MTQDTRKQEVLQVRLSQQQKLDIQRKADAAGMSLSDYVRTLALKADVDVIAQLVIHPN